MRGQSILVKLSLAIVFGLSLSAIAQENSNTNKAKRRGPLPSYFGKLGVGDEQREKLYDVQDSFEKQIADLRQQIKKLIVERDSKMESLLTPGQKLRLKELKDAAIKKAPVGKKPALNNNSDSSE